MRKGFIKIISCILCICSLVAVMCFSGCAGKSGNKLGHVVDPKPLGGEKQERCFAKISFTKDGK